MPLIARLRFEPSELKPIDPATILDLLYEVRANIAGIEDEFATVDLSRVLEVIESGEYRSRATATQTILVDLSAAKSTIQHYRANTEGGCRSCHHMGREIIDAQDASSFRYCMNGDPECSRTTRAPYAGISSKIRKHLETPCESWNPRIIGPKLEDLVAQEKARTETTAGILQPAEVTAD